MIGTTITHYRITTKLGQGGMGEVYRATDTKLNRDVALKVLPESFAQNAQRMGRFDREAQMLASLNHPNIAAIYGVEEFDGQKALVMELAEGEDLSTRIARGPIPLEEALPIALQIAEALEDAHEKGIIHRDLKPANIKVTTEGRVKVLDFGLAKALEEERTSEEVADSPTLSMAATQAGIILGTAAYMSPEQARGMPADKRADIWAFGVVLFEMLAGRRAFLGEDLSLTLASVMKDDPNWETLPRETPAKIRTLLERCLNKDAIVRLRDIGEARIAIASYLANPAEGQIKDVAPVVAGPGGRQKLAFGGAIVLALLFGVLFTWTFTPVPEPQSPTPIRLEANLSVDQPLYLDRGNAVALSPDGRLLAFVTGTEPNTSLQLRSLDRLESQVLAGTEQAYAPFFSPDGLWLGFFTGNALKKVSISGGTPMTLCSVPNDSRGASWGAEGNIVFAPQTGNGLMQVSASGGAPQELIPLAAGEIGHAWPQFLPGSRHVLFRSDRGLGTGGHIEVLDVQTGQRKQIHPGGRYPRYAASGHLLYVDSGTLFAAPFDLDESEMTAEPVPVLEDISTDRSPRGVAHYEVTRDGTLAYLAGSSSEGRALVWVDEEGEVTIASKARRSYGGFFDLSPEGERLATTIASNENIDIWIVDLDRDLQTRVTFDQGEDSYPAWSPDGRSIYFYSGRSGNPGIYLKSADGSGEAELLLDGNTAGVVRDVSRDGKFLAYCPPGAGRGTDIFVLALEADRSPEPFLATPAYEGSPRFSPDGQWMAYDSDETGRFEVYVRRFSGPGGKFQVSGEGGFRPHWSQDGHRLFYRTDDAIWESTFGVQGETLQVGKARRLVELEGRYDQSLALAADGKRFLLIRDDQEEGGDRFQLTFVLNWFQELQRFVPTE